MSNQNSSAIIVQFILAFIMLAVAFEVKMEDLKSLPRQWKKIVVGYLLQIVFLPSYILIMLLIINPSNQMVLAFLLLAACPGGNLSQLFVIRSNGSVGLSMGLTFFSTLLSPLTVPGIFYLATHVNSHWIEAYRSLDLSWSDIFKTLIQSLFIPLVIGMWLSNRKEKAWLMFMSIIQKSVPVLLLILLVGAVWNFRSYIAQISLSMVFMVIALSFSSLVTSYYISRLLGHEYITSITYAWEVSIQNSGLGMVLGIVYFSNIPEVSLVCALWGIWQIFMGFTMSGILKKYFVQKEVVCQISSVG